MSFRHSVGKAVAHVQLCRMPPALTISFVSSDREQMAVGTNLFDLDAGLHKETQSIM